MKKLKPALLYFPKTTELNDNIELYDDSMNYDNIELYIVIFHHTAME